MRSPNLTPKVTLAFVIFAAGLLLVVGILAYTNGRDALEAATFSDLLSVAIEKEAAFEAWISAGQTQIASLSQSPMIQQRIAVLHDERVDDEEMLASHADIVAAMRPFVGAGRSFETLMILDPVTGEVVAATNSREEGKFKENRLYFLNGREGPYVQNVYFALECECPAMTASAPILADDGAIQGVLAGRMNLNAMGAIINRTTEMRQTADAYLINTANILVTQPRFITDAVVLQRGIRTEATQQCLVGESGSMMDRDYRGEPTMTVYRWLPDRDLCLIVEVDQSEALAPVYAFGRTLLAISLITLVAASGVSAALARTITGPILALKDRVTRFGQGEMDIRLSEFSSDEIGDLGREFNAMADSIVEKETLLQDYAKDLEKRVAERTEQLQFLANVSQELSLSFDYLDRLRTLAQLAVPRFADWCSVDVLNDSGRLERLAVVHSDPQKIALAYELQRRYPPDPNGSSGAYHVLKTGEPEFYPTITDEMLTASLPNSDLLDLVRELGLRSSIMAPLRAHGHTLGVITLVMAESGRTFDDNDLSLVQDLAQRAGLLIDNARLYYETQQLNEELEARVVERTSHLTAVNRELEAFSYSVSHDLRAPLRAVDGFGQALLEDYDHVLDEMGRDFLNRIRMESQRMGQLIDDLIGLSRITRSDMTLSDVNLSEIAREVVKDLEIHEPDRAVQLSIQPDIHVCADERLMRVALQNLISNAWKFTSKKSSAVIEFGCRDGADTKEYYVRDNGAGFDMNYANKLFGAFQRLHSMDEFSGTGIGLATVQRIMHRHGGTVRAEGVVNEGAAFYFTLGPGNCD